MRDEVMKKVTFQQSICLFIFGCAGSSLPCGLFSGCGQWGYSLVVVCGLLIAVASLVTEHRLQSSWASVVLDSGAQAKYISLWGTQAQFLRGTWIFPEQGLNPCLLRCQVDSLLLSHQRRPIRSFFERRFSNK